MLRHSWLIGLFLVMVAEPCSANEKSATSGCAEKTVKKKTDTQTVSNGSKKAVPKTGSKKVVTLKKVSFTFRWCPAGSFSMGSNSGDSDEKPVHSVKFAKGF